MEELELLIDDYRRRLNTIATEIKNSVETYQNMKVARLEIKASCYRTFLHELEKCAESLTNKK